MCPQFQLNRIDRDLTEFGLQLETREGEEIVVVPCSPEVKGALLEMLMATLNRMRIEAGNMECFQPAQKYSSEERLQLPLDSPLAEKARQLKELDNIARSSGVKGRSREMKLYFARFYDASGQRIVAVRRATRFKGIVKDRIIQLGTDTVKLVEDELFRLDHDFDYVAMDQIVYIMRPSGFEFTSDIDEQVRKQAKKTAKELGKKITFIDFDGMADFIYESKRASRLIASIRTWKDLDKIDKSLFQQCCAENQIAMQSNNGKISPEQGHEIDFLSVLDRRMYNQKLIQGQDELYVAPNRRRRG